jgi:DNA mismatch endonuclease (patch repair protein)
VDTVTAKRRSEIMSRIRSRNTAPERRVRSALHAAGLRFRIHRSDLPGRPDVVLPSARVCVFVQGCFWHGCRRCVDGRRRVKSNTAFWLQKVAGNRARDARHLRALRTAGWKVFLIWECDTERPEAVQHLVVAVSACRRWASKQPLRRAVA